MSEQVLCWGCQMPHSPTTMARFVGTKNSWPTLFQGMEVPGTLIAYFCRDCFVDGLRSSDEDAQAPLTLMLPSGTVAHLSPRRRHIRCLVCGSEAVILWPQDTDLYTSSRRGVPLCSKHYARAQYAGDLTAAWHESTSS